jgi:hypothetical protein
MVVEFILDEDDFLLHQLYAASKSGVFKKNRKLYRNIVSIVYALIGVFFLIEHMYLSAVFFFAFAIIWFFAMPRWRNKTYIKHFKNHVREHLKNNFGKKVKLSFEDDLIVSSNEGSEMKTSSSEIEEIAEIPSTIFIKLRSGHWYILPKAKIANMEELVIKLKELAPQWNVNYTDDNKWQWK